MATASESQWIVQLAWIDLQLLIPLPAVCVCLCLFVCTVCVSVCECCNQRYQKQSTFKLSEQELTAKGKRETERRTEVDGQRVAPKEMRARRVKRLKVCNDRTNKSKCRFESKTHVSLAQQKTTETETESERGESRAGRASSLLDGQLSWQLAVGRATHTHTKSVCQGEKQMTPSPSLFLSLSYTRLSATEAP